MNFSDIIGLTLLKERKQNPSLQFPQDGFLRSSAAHLRNSKPAEKTPGGEDGRIAA